MKQLLESVYWQLNKQLSPALKEHIETDIVVVGGGIAGLSAAHAFSQLKKNVVLIEKQYCGSGASGRSSGFITPESELNLISFVEKFGASKGKRIWEFGKAGVQAIKMNVNEFSIECDYQAAPTLVVTKNKKKLKELRKDCDQYKKLKYECIYFDKTGLTELIDSKDYVGGISYNDTFGINPFLYCQRMKHELQKMGVRIYEETPAIACGNSFVQTPHGSIKARNIILCIDYNLAELGKLPTEVYHAQTFILLSERTNKEAIEKLFPSKPFLVWDTELIYNYFRVTGDYRLMIGGGSIFCTYDRSMHYGNNRVISKLISYVRKTFPQFTYNFEYVWPGLIGISKDIAPIAGFDVRDKSLYYITAAAGLPWAAALGYYSAEQILHNNKEFDFCFSPNRKFPLPGFTQYIIGKKATFAFSNLMTIGSL